MSTSVTSLIGLNSAYKSLIDNLIIVESSKKFTYQDQIKAQEAKRTAISSVGSKLTAFNRVLTDFASPHNNLFNLFAASSSNEAAFSISSTSTLSAPGSYNIEIQQLAKADVRVSKQYTALGNQIANEMAASSNTAKHDFKITVNGNVYEISIDDVTGKSNEDIFQSIADKINEVAGDDVQASLVRETDNTVRLSVRSKETGKEAAIAFSKSDNDTNNDIDERDSISEIIQFTTKKGADKITLFDPDKKAGGRIYDLNTLNAQFTIDGLRFERGTNTVTNAINGLTINLKQVTTAVETLTIGADKEASMENINNFVSSYNSVITEIRQQTFLNGETGNRGPLYSDRAFRDLTFTLRQNLISTALNPNVTLVDDGFGNLSIPNGINTQTILDIGFDVNQDGTLYIKDQALLEKTLTENPDIIKNLFSSNRSDSYSGIAGKMQKSIGSFIKSDGLITSLTINIDDRIKQLNQSISIQDNYLSKRRDMLTNQFIQLQSITEQATSQYQTLASMGSFYG